MSDNRPLDCRFRLQDEGKAYPKSACWACGKSITTGLGNHCTSVPAPAVPDDVADLIEDIQSDECTGDIRSYLASRIIATIEAQAAELARKDEALQRIADWSDAYPTTVFPEPDFARAAAVLAAAGMSLDVISASNMRHATQGVGKIAHAALTHPTGV